jgi:hypothetical protein
MWDGSNWHHPLENKMATLKQIEVNRRNPLHSTGPGTPQGKAVVRLNPLRHGLRARTVLLPGESREEFHQLCNDLEAEWQPQTRTEQFYLEQMAVSHWKLARMEVGEVDIFRQAASAGKDQIPLLDRLWQAQCRMERSHARAQRELERLQAARRSSPPVEEPPAPPKIEEIRYAAASPPVSALQTAVATLACLAPSAATMFPPIEPGSAASRPEAASSRLFKNAAEPGAA